MAESIAENIARIEERIAAACRRAGRRREDVRLIAVSKTVGPERVREAYGAGLRDFGENRVQEAASKRVAVADLDITWHMIGHLQSNKVKPALEVFHWFHSLDSLRLAERLDRARSETSGIDTRPDATDVGGATEPAEAGRLPVLIEVNLGGEETKSGAPESALEELAQQIGFLPHLDLRGLMVIPPFDPDPEKTRPYFSRLSRLAKVVHSANRSSDGRVELSMGMSHDFEVAVEEGATLVRVGTAIFGGRI